MQLSPFSQPGQFYKGNLHLHSTRSDGSMSPAAVIEAYRSRGYDFVSLTDHFLPETHFRKDANPESFITVSDTRDLRSEGFTTILGAELHGPAMENGEIWHIVAAGLPLDFTPLQPGESGLDVARRAVDAGAFVGHAHPHWNSASVVDALQVAAFAHSVEIYNHSCQVGVDRGDSWYMLDLLSEQGFRLSAYAADDAHFNTAKRPDGFGGWVEVKAESLAPEALVAALKAGAFYSSTGMHIHNIEIENDQIVVECDPAITILASGNGAKYRREHGTGLTQASFPLERYHQHGFVRITVIGEDGTRAWSNPIWLDQ
jgi:hypothetical protein